jgi:hypothetical protein
MSDERTLTLREAQQIRTDIANLETGLEVVMAQLARQKGERARTALGVILATAVITTLMVWFIAHL